MGGRIQFASTGMDVVMKDPMDIRFFTIGYIVEIYLKHSVLNQDFEGYREYLRF
jgi:hypothetical protein